jgi:hypothetical protein
LRALRTPYGTGRSQHARSISLSAG